MTSSESVLAYSRAYYLFSQIMLVGMTDELLSIVNHLPKMENIKPKPTDDWKADHYALFGMNVFPFETVFLSEDGLLGGQITDAVANSFYEAGFSPDESETVDHIGNQLGLMAFLSGAEAESREDGVVQAIYHAVHLQRQFLDRHLLRWLPALVFSIHRQGNETFSVIADLMLDLAFSHRKSLDDDLMNPTQPLTLPPPPNILEDASTTLSDIAEFLLTPVYSGIYLSRDDIARLGMRFRLPRGFGKRHQMLTNLIQTAIDYDTVDDLMHALQDEVHIWREFYMQRVLDKRFSGAWMTRLDETTQFLQTIRDAL